VAEGAPREEGGGCSAAPRLGSFTVQEFPNVGVHDLDPGGRRGPPAVSASDPNKMIICMPSVTS
jgi:hypothetical protein